MRARQEPPTGLEDDDRGGDGDEDLHRPDRPPVEARDPEDRDQEPAVQRLRVGRRVTRDVPERAVAEIELGEDLRLLEVVQDRAALVQRARRVAAARRPRSRSDRRGGGSCSGHGATYPLGKITHMPDAQGYAVVSCHVERPLDDEVWGRYRALIERRPGGFPIASLMRPPAEGEDESLFVSRARDAASLGPYGHHIHWTSPTHARPTGPDPAAAVRREGAWLREQGLEPRFFCGGGWYIDADVIAAVADLGYADCTATAWRPSYLPGGSPRAGLAQPAPGRAPRRPPRPRAADHAFAGRAREVAARLAAAGRPRPLPRLRAARGAPPLGALLGARDPRAPTAPGRARRSRAPTRRSGGTPSTLADRDRARSRRSPAAARARRRSGISFHVDTSPFRVTVLDDGKAVVSEDEACAASLRARLHRRRVLAHEGHLVEGRRLSGRDDRAGPDGDGDGGDDGDRGRDRTSCCTRRAGIQSVYDAFDAPGRTSISSAAARRASRVDLRGQILPDPGRVRSARASRSRSSPAPAAGGSGWPSQRSAALAFPGSTGGSGCERRRRLAVQLPPALTDRAEVCLQGASSTSTSTSARSSRSSPTTRPRPGCRSCRRSRSSS